MNYCRDPNDFKNSLADYSVTNIKIFDIFGQGTKGRCILKTPKNGPFRTLSSLSDTKYLKDFFF